MKEKIKRYFTTVKKKKKRKKYLSFLRFLLVVLNDNNIFLGFLLLIFPRLRFNIVLRRTLLVFTIATLILILVRYVRLRFLFLLLNFLLYFLFNFFLILFFVLVTLILVLVFRIFLRVFRVITLKGDTHTHIRKVNLRDIKNFKGRIKSEVGRWVGIKQERSTIKSRSDDDNNNKGIPKKRTNLLFLLVVLGILCLR